MNVQKAAGLASSSTSEPSTIPVDSHQSASIANTKAHVGASPAPQSDPMETLNDSVPTSSATKKQNPACVTPLRPNVNQGPKEKKPPATIENNVDQCSRDHGSGLKDSNSFSILSDRPEDYDKENIHLKRPRRPTYKVAKTLDKAIDAQSKAKKLALKRMGYLNPKT